MLKKKEKKQIPFVPGATDGYMTNPANERDVPNPGSTEEAKEKAKENLHQSVKLIPTASVYIAMPGR